MGAWSATAAAALLALNLLCACDAAPTSTTTTTTAATPTSTTTTAAATTSATSECARVCARFHLTLNTFYRRVELIPPAEREGASPPMSYAMRMAMADCRGFKRSESGKVVGCPPNKLLTGLNFDTDNAYECMKSNRPGWVDCCAKYKVCP